MVAVIPSWLTTLHPWREGGAVEVAFVELDAEGIHGLYFRGVQGRSGGAVCTTDYDGGRNCYDERGEEAHCTVEYLCRVQLEKNRAAPSDL